MFQLLQTVVHRVYQGVVGPAHHLNDSSPRRERLQLRLTWLHINADSGAIGASSSESFGGKYTSIYVYM